MGCNFLGRSSWSRAEAGTPAPNDPRPDAFFIKRAVQFGDYVVAEIKYPHATNFEGNKILVFKNSTVSEVHEMREIDPHFLEGNKAFARFRPSEDGWFSAVS